MPSHTEISVPQLIRLVGTPQAPVVLDVRTEEEFERAPLLVPGSVRTGAGSRQAPSGSSRPVVVVCQDGGARSQGQAALLRDAGFAAETLDGGFAAWEKARAPLVAAARIPERNMEGRTVWVTRSRPKVDRIACPWLIRRFVDPGAVFLFVSVSEVLGVAERFNATPFDIEGVFWCHRGVRCTFDTMLDEFGLRTEPLDRLAAIVRAADTDNLDREPQAAGLLAASLGLSRMYRDDIEQLGAGMLLYDAFFRWARDAVDETHEWPGPRKS